MSTSRAHGRNGRRNAIVAGAAGAVLATGALWVADIASGPANAQGPAIGGGGFTLSIAQLRINQRISSAAVRRSNESLQLLDPIRPVEGLPEKVLGWDTASLRDGAVTGPKIGDGSVTGPKIGDASVAPEKLSNPTFSAVVGAGGQLDRGTGVVSSTLVGPPIGQYHVIFSRDVTACAFTVSQGGISTVVSAGFASAARLANVPNGVRVRTWNAHGPNAADIAPVPTNRAFHLIVQC